MENSTGKIVFGQKAIDSFRPENSVNVIHSMDAEIIRQTPEELNQANEEHHPIIRQCKHCGKKNGGHFIMCTAWID